MRSGVVWALLVFCCCGSAAAWIPETNLTPGAAGAAAPAMTTGPDGKIHCVYPVQTSGGQLNLIYRCWTGTAWSAPRDLPSPNYKEPECDIAVDSNNHVHIVGTYRIDGTLATPYTVYYWEYDGTTWTGPVMLSSGAGNDSNNCKTPRIAIDGYDNLHVVWSQDGMVGGAGDIIYVKRQGSLWQTRKNVSSNPTAHAYGSVAPDVAVDRVGNNVHIVWHDDSIDNTTFQVWYTKNTNMGDPSAWLPSNQWFMISTIVYGKSPRLVLDRSDYPNVFWTDKFGGSTNVQGYRRWDGSGWTASQSWGGQWFFDGVFDQDNVLRYVYWEGSPQELYYRTYNYSTWTPGELVSTGVDTLKADFAAMALDANGTPFSVWEERKNSLPANIYYSARGSCGAPGPVQSLSAVGFDTEVRLSWTNPPGLSYSGTMIRYKTTDYPTGPADGTLVCDRAGVAGGSDQFTHEGVTNGLTCYYAAFAHDDCGNCSTAVLASATPHIVTLAEAKELPDNTPIGLFAKRVIAIFAADACYYIEEEDRSSAIRASGSSAGLSVGDIVNVSGVLSTRVLSGMRSERQIMGVATRLSGATPLRPLGMGCRQVGGRAIGTRVPGVTDAAGRLGVGVNNFGLLVKIAGKVTAVSGNYFWLDDGSGIPDYSGNTGVLVYCPSLPGVAVKDIVSAIGVIEGSVPVGWTANRRCIHVRDVADIRRSW